MDLARELDHRVLRELIEHLQDRPQVQNIDLMNVSGFCRNCLGKWRHKAARELDVEGTTLEQSMEYIYGMPYEEYKKRYQTKATPEQLEQFKAMGHSDVFAKHEGFDPNPVPMRNPLLSSVCCEPVLPDQHVETPQQSSIYCSFAIRCAILTISDRASNGTYEDLSGPIIQKVLSQSGLIIGRTAVIPDSLEEIRDKLIDFASDHDVILSTGGTGLSPKDLTPEATASVIDRELPGISEMLRRETAREEPLSWLSRAQAGVREKCAIINLPGHPRAAQQCSMLLIPLFPRIVQLIKE